MLDTLGKVLIELRDDPAVAAIVSNRVRAVEPASGDAKGPAEYQAFVVLRMLASPRERRLPMQRPRVSVECYGRTHQEAGQLYGACSDAIHQKGPRVHGNGLGIYSSHDDTGGSADRDPDTGQPLYRFVIELSATTQVVAA